MDNPYVRFPALLAFISAVAILIIMVYTSVQQQNITHALNLGLLSITSAIAGYFMRQTDELNKLKRNRK